MNFFKKNYRWLIILLLIISAGVAAQYFGVRFEKDDLRAVLEFVPLWPPLTFALVFLLVALCGFPTVPWFLLAGTFFDSAFEILFATGVGNTLLIGISYFLGYLGKDWKFFSGIREKSLKLGFSGSGSSAIGTTLILRYLPFPYGIQGIVAGAFKIHFLTYFVVSVLESIPWIFGFGLMGQAFGESRWPLILAGIGFLLIVGFVSRTIRKNLNIKQS